MLSLLWFLSLPFQICVIFLPIIFLLEGRTYEKRPPGYVRASQRQEVYTGQNYLLELVLILFKVVSSRDAVIRILLHKGEGVKISL